MGYIKDHLSVYRLQGSDAEYRNPSTLTGKCIRFAWVAYAVQAWQDKMLSDDDFLKALTNSLKGYSVSVPEDEMSNSLADNISCANGDLSVISNHIIGAWSALQREVELSLTNV
jgi:hypothetical protein